MSTTLESPNEISQRDEQVRRAEEVLASLPQAVGVAKGLFDGRFVADWVLPYPQLAADQRDEVAQAVGDLERFCDAHLDPEQIDREADIPREVIDGLGALGVL
ncbi:MAG TPA: acyl-CoA dehydrogenase, partial [Lacipirellulaceae bacterium]